MVRRYRGDGCVSRFLDSCDDPSACIKVKMKPAQIHYFTKIMEAYCHLVFLSPVRPREGIVALYATPDNMPEVREILANFPHPVEIVE
ncbi:MAG: hypothetical protein CVU89_08340 [Firmicutes bacterium HGW-Firmicutes-14]|nr:MAG: hypothetical protein CVU89_08340 [Firmicutes bacterium HGW-Firmicutes-14]